MSAPIPPVAPAPIEPTAGRRGCWKKALVGCGVAALILCAGLLGLILYLRQRPETVTDLVMKQVESHYAADVTTQEKEDLRAAYAGFRAALKERRVPQEPLERFRATFISSGPQNEVTREQVRELTALFRRAAASGPTPGSPTSTAPSPRPSP